MMRRRAIGTKEKRNSKVSNHKKTKVRKLALWLRILIIMKMKYYTLLLNINLMMKEIRWHLSLMLVKIIHGS